MTSPSSSNEVSWAHALGVLRFWLAVVGPRRHDDWMTDALAVMERRVPDPRGWSGTDAHEASCERTSQHPSFPLRSLNEQHLNHNLELISPAEAAQLMEVQAAEYGYEPWLAPGYGLPARAGEIRSATSTVLARFGADAECFTNAQDLSGDSRPDWSARDFCFSCFAASTARQSYVLDLGVLCVSETEVGVFWTYMVD